MNQSRFERKLHEVHLTDHGRLAVLTIAAAAVVVIVSITTMTSGELTAADGAGPSRAADTARAPQADTGFIYFPAQYVNQATEPSEHIEAF